MIKLIGGSRSENGEIVYTFTFPTHTYMRSEESARRQLASLLRFILLCPTRRLPILFPTCTPPLYAMFADMHKTCSLSGCTQTGEK
ncbi:unnamed protein product [Protopolystoma xenopodis]|uniref:Uncharacterized protein n=1 Tax=Protopolystoma xenopodis TaxID=117903 RepID=A0A3S5FHD6_9PLAT|nr:unnamed protein product [Protopolystoma xenopodis]